MSRGTKEADIGHNSGGVDEVWRLIVDHPDYMVSSKGRVMCIARRRYMKPGDIVAQCIVPNGYCHINLDGKPYGVHRVVCAAFYGDPPSEKHVAAHNNGVKTDNRPENLRWATYSENSFDMDKHGTRFKPAGSAHGASKLVESDIPLIRRMRARGLVQKEIAAQFGVCRTTINAVLNGYSWGHI